MSAPPMQQNFRGHCGVLLSLHPAPTEALGMLPLALQRLGMEFLFRDAAADPVPLEPERDLLFIDGDEDLPAILALVPAAELAGVPVIGLLGVEAPGRLRGLMNAGAMAFLRKPVYASAVYAALFLGVNAHRARRRSDLLLAEHEQRRRGRRFLIQATVRVMREHGVEEGEAYALLRRAAMRARQSIEDYSQTWLAEPTDPAISPRRTA